MTMYNLYNNHPPIKEELTGKYITDLEYLFTLSNPHGEAKNAKKQSPGNNNNETLNCGTIKMFTKTGPGNNSVMQRVSIFTRIANLNKLSLTKIQLCCEGPTHSHMHSKITNRPVRWHAVRYGHLVGKTNPIASVYS